MKVQTSAAGIIAYIFRDNKVILFAEFLKEVKGNGRPITGHQGPRGGVKV
jgi:hypothetical protein